MTFFFRSDQELNSGPSGCHALMGVLDHRATSSGTYTPHAPETDLKMKNSSKISKSRDKQYKNQ